MSGSTARTVLNLRLCSQDIQVEYERTPSAASLLACPSTSARCGRDRSSSCVSRLLFASASPHLVDDRVQALTASLQDCAAVSERPETGPPRRSFPSGQALAIVTSTTGLCPIDHFTS